jgi:multiple antibiotic resistance protein
VGVALHDVKPIMSLARMGGAMLALIIIGVLLYLAFRYGEHFLRLIGEAGTAVFLRLTAFILLCLGVQIVWEGLRELLLEITAVPTHLVALQASLTSRQGENFHG